MATLSEIFSDSASLEKILAGLIGAGTAAAGISQATTPRTTTVTAGTPGAPSPLETEALGNAFGITASQFPSQGLTRTPTGMSFTPTPQEQQSVLGLQQALNAMRSRVGGGPISLQGPADAMTNASMTGRPTMDRSRLIAALKTKLTGPISATAGQGANFGSLGQGTTIDMNRGADGSFSAAPSGGVNFPSSSVNFPGSTPGAANQPKISTSGAGGLGSVLGTGTGILGAGAGALQIAKALGLIGSNTADGGIGSMNPIQLLILARQLGLNLPAGVGINTPQTLAANIKDALGMSNNTFGLTGNLPDEGGTIQELLNVFGLKDSTAGATEFQNFADMFSPSDGGVLGTDAGSQTFGPGDGGGGFLDSIGGLGTLGSVLGLGTGIAGLAGGGDTASKALGGIGTATSGLSLASSLGLLPAMGALGPIGMGVGLISFLSSLLPNKGAESDAQALKGENMWIANIQSNPTKWIADMEHALPGVGGNLATKSLGGQIKGRDDMLRELGMSDIAGTLYDYNITRGWAGNLPGSTLQYGSPMWAAVNLEANQGYIQWLFKYADTVRRAKAEGLPWPKEVANATNQDPQRFIEALSQMDTETFKRQMYGTPNENGMGLSREIGGGDDRSTVYFDPKTLQWIPPGRTDNSSD